MSRLATPPAFDVGSESLLNGFICGPWIESGAKTETETQRTSSVGFRERLS